MGRRVAAVALVHHQMRHFMTEDFVKKRLATGTRQEKIDSHESTLQVGAPQ